MSTTTRVLFGEQKDENASGIVVTSAQKAASGDVASDSSEAGSVFFHYYPKHTLLMDTESDTARQWISIRFTGTQVGTPPDRLLSSEEQSGRGWPMRSELKMLKCS